MSCRSAGADGGGAACDDAAVADSAVCVVFRHKRDRDDADCAGDDVFICVQCRAEAVQLFGIQDSIYGDLDQAASSSRE